MVRIVAINQRKRTGGKGSKALPYTNTPSTVENRGLKKTAPEQQRALAKQRKALKKAQRDKARSLPSKPRIERPIPANNYEIEMYRAIKAVHLNGMFALHRFLQRKGAGGYLVRLDVFDIDGAKLSPSDIEEMQPMLESIPVIAVLGAK